MDKQTYQLIRFLKEETDQMEVKDDGDVYCWISYGKIQEFHELAGHSPFDDGGIEATLVCDCVFFIANDLLDHFNIDYEIFK